MWKTWAWFYFKRQSRWYLYSQQQSCANLVLYLKIKRVFINIVFFANSFAATAGTNTRNTTFKIVHSDLLHQYSSAIWKCHNWGITQFNVQKSQYCQISNKTVKTYKTNLKTAGAVILQLALKLQKGNNFSVIPI